jgi:dipeptidyl aminopeptidase/acylaminoacyl peptidase
VSFLLADHGDPAGAEFQDVLDGIQHLADRGLIDKNRVGIMGGSYGGYFSAWASTKHSSWFTASVVNYGVSNLYSDWGDGDIPWEHRLVHWGWFPVDRPLLAMDRSPVTWVRGSTTATLIMHGKADPRVPAAQSRELYNGLRLNEDLDVEFVLFPREGHGYRESPHRLEACRRALAWMVQHLGLIQAQTDTSGGA